MAGQEAKRAKRDIFNWTMVVVLLIAAISANYYFIAVPLPLRLVGWLLLVLVMIAFAYKTYLGEKLWKFFKEARNEMQKVVWPTRHETFQTTLIVIAMAVVIAIFLWGFDVFFMWMISSLTT